MRDGPGPRGWAVAMRYHPPTVTQIVEAQDVTVGDVVPNVGTVTEVVRAGRDVTITALWNGWQTTTTALAPDAVVWVTRGTNPWPVHP